MGIKNFQTYAETFFGPGCFKEFSVQTACLDIEDFFYYHVLQPVSQMALEERSSPVKYTPTFDRCGVYIDLASFMYGLIMSTLEKTTQYKRITTLINSNEKMVVVDLDQETIEIIVKECASRLIDTLRPLLLKAYRIYLAYDKFSPLTKTFEQNNRKKKVQFSLSKTSKDKCFENIVLAVRRSVSRCHRERLDNELDQIGLTPNADELVENIERAVRKQFTPYNGEDVTPFCPSTPFTVGEGEWKCFYRLRDDINDELIDRCYIFGRDWDIGFAMTIYQHPRIPNAIRYVYGINKMFEHVELFDDRKKALHSICLSLFGNDYIGGLIYLGDSNVKLLKREFDQLYSDRETCTSHQLDFLANTLFAQRDLTESEEAEDDPEKRLKISRAFATVVSRLILSVYAKSDGDYINSPDSIEDVLYYANIYNIECRPNADTLKLREQLANHRRVNEEEQQKNLEFNDNLSTPEDVEMMPSRPKKRKIDGHVNENTQLICKDKRGRLVTRTLQQCMDSFASGTLWYLSYALFYFKSPAARQRMRVAKSQEEGTDMALAIGLSMGRSHTFRYNDTRLNNRYDPHQRLELKRIIRQLNSCLMYWIIECAFDYALNLQ